MQGIIVSHEIGEWLEFGIHMKMCDGESCGIVNAKGLVEGVTKQGDGAVGDDTNGVKYNVFRQSQKKNNALDVKWICSQFNVSVVGFKFRWKFDVVVGCCRGFSAS